MVTETTNQHRDEMVIFQDIQQAQKEALGLQYGVFVNEFVQFEAQGVAFWEFLASNAHQDGQPYPHRERVGKPMFIEVSIKVGFKAAEGDTEPVTKTLAIKQAFRTEEQKAMIGAKDIKSLGSPEELAMLNTGTKNEITGLDDLFKSAKFMYDTNLKTSKNVFANSSSQEILSARAWWAANAVSDAEAALEAKQALIEELKQERKDAINAE